VPEVETPARFNQTSVAIGYYDRRSAITLSDIAVSNGPSEWNRDLVSLLTFAPCMEQVRGEGPCIVHEDTQDYDRSRWNPHRPAFKNLAWANLQDIRMSTFSQPAFRLGENVLDACKSLKKKIAIRPDQERTE
jgi:hypothetical protein